MSASTRIICPSTRRGGFIALIYLLALMMAIQIVIDPYLNPYRDVLPTANTIHEVLEEDKERSGNVLLGNTNMTTDSGSRNDLQEEQSLSPSSSSQHNTTQHKNLRSSSIAQVDDKIELVPGNSTITNKVMNHPLPQEIPTLLPTASNSKTSKAAIVTKILWENDLQILKQWVCLINHGYNDRMKHDFIVFTTMPWKPENVAELQKVAYPANLTVAVEAPPLEEQIAAMTQEEKDFLYKRCNVQENQTISWFHHCTEPSYRGKANLGYSWQAEFRSYHIWTHPALKDYKYMMWIDSDASVGKTWDIDPIRVMVENDLTILYAGFPYGKTQNNHQLKDKLIAAYNTSICDVKNGKHPDNGEHILYAETCSNERGATFMQIAGNHHVTDLDVFRKDVHQQFLKNFTGDYRFRRSFDDQMAVTIVGVMEQYLVNNRTDIPKKSVAWHETSHGMPLRIAHHGMYDAVRSDRANAHKHAKMYKNLVANWTGLEERCGTIFK